MAPTVKTVNEIVDWGGVKSMIRKTLLLCFFVMCLLCGCNASTDSDIIQVLEVKEETFVSEAKSISISYPKLNDKNDNLNESVNTQIREVALKQYNLYNVHENFIINQIYDVSFVNDEIVSVVFSGDVYATDYSHPNNFCHAITLNLSSGRKYNMFDFISSDNIMKAILENKFEILFGGLKLYSSEQLYDFVEDTIENNEIAENFYITDDKYVCIIFELPYGAGDYSLVKIQRPLE